MTPKTGDPCSRRQCSGTLAVYCSRLISGGRFRQRFFRCGRCGSTADACSVERVEPSTDPSTAGCTTGVPAGRMDHMDTTDPRYYWQDDWLTAFELGKWFDLPDTDTALGMVEDGLLPQPRVFQPLRWHADDLRMWTLHQEKTAC